METRTNASLRTGKTTRRWVLRHAAGVLIVSAFAGVAIDRSGSVAAAPASCVGAQATGSEVGAPASGSTETAAIPTEPAIAPEVNPPGDIPDNQAFVTYTSAEGGYAITMPEGWARTESGPDVAFVDKLHRFTVEIACADTAPTLESVTSSEIARLAAREPSFALVDTTAVELPAGPTILIRYQTNSAPDEVTGKQIRLDVDRYEVFRDGRLAAISLAGPAGSDNVDVSNQVSRSFQWTE